VSSAADVSAAPDRCPGCDVVARPTGIRRGHGEYARCPKCRSLWLRPFPDTARLAQIYAADYFERWGIDTPGRLAEVRAMKEATYRGFLERIARYRSSGALLDIGCVVGFLLGVAGRAGYEAYGIDRNASAVEQAKSEFGERVEVGDLQDSRFPGITFAVVTMVDVLEHVPEPAALLAAVAKRLEPEGVLALLLPNASSWTARILRGAWPHLAEEHLWLWTPTGLEAFLARHGWRVLELQTGVRKTFTARYLASYRRALGSWSPPGTGLLDGLRFPAFTGEMIVLARFDDGSPTAKR
jgi:2-polyprenyl-3-methyl-5-hydroxy-6-metoxy-1,4-benzoquinol methylase